MTQTVWKYPLATVSDQLLEVPGEATPLSVAVQFGELCLWVLVDPEKGRGPVHIKIFGTGQPISEGGLQFIGTYQLYDGNFVGHVFVVKE